MNLDLNPYNLTTKLTLLITMSCHLYVTGKAKSRLAKSRRYLASYEIPSKVEGVRLMKVFRTFP